jgi:hypothetical protein
MYFISRPLFITLLATYNKDNHSLNWNKAEFTLTSARERHKMNN